MDVLAIRLSPDREMLTAHLGLMVVLGKASRIGGGSQKAEVPENTSLAEQRETSRADTTEQIEKKGTKESNTLTWIAQASLIFEAKQGHPAQYLVRGP